eukprot:scaffold94240_cov69-Phaeocystis_antarctica.AAC.4
MAGRSSCAPLLRSLRIIAFALASISNSLSTAPCSSTTTRQGESLWSCSSGGGSSAPLSSERNVCTQCTKVSTCPSLLSGVYRFRVQPSVPC